jgi:hypothetical protein
MSLVEEEVEVEVDMTEEAKGRRSAKADEAADISTLSPSRCNYSYTISRLIIFRSY